MIPFMTTRATLDNNEDKSAVKTNLKEDFVVGLVEDYVDNYQEKSKFCPESPKVNKFMA